MSEEDSSSWPDDEDPFSTIEEKVEEEEEVQESIETKEVDEVAEAEESEPEAVIYAGSRTTPSVGSES